jgi:hypothetical protein
MTPASSHQMKPSDRINRRRRSADWRTFAATRTWPMVWTVCDTAGGESVLIARWNFPGERLRELPCDAVDTLVAATGRAHAPLPVTEA